MRASQRLTDSPACLVAAKSGPDLEIERLLARQNRGVGAKPILELNMQHALVKALARAKGESHDADVTDLSALLFEQAQILDGEVPDDPAAFAARLNRLVVRGLGVPRVAASRMARYPRPAEAGRAVADAYPLIRSTVAPQRPSLSSSRSKPRSR